MWHIQIVEISMKFAMSTFWWEFLDAAAKHPGAPGEILTYPILDQDNHEDSS
jgi:hypothetical protein